MINYFPIKVEMNNHIIEKDLKFYIGKWIKNSWSKDFYPDSLVGEDVLKWDFTYEKGLPFSVCVGIDGDYLKMRYKNEIFHVKDWEGITIMPTPGFVWGDKVQEVERSEVAGEIIRIQWHTRDQEYKYYISINGKPKSRRYNSNELILMN